MNPSTPLAISKVGPEITALAINPKGTLMAYADTKGEIKFKEIAKKLYSSSFKNHSKAVHALQFVPSKNCLLSGGDDLSINLVNYATTRNLLSIKKAHSDYIRCIGGFADSPDVMISGSYDKTVKLFDVRDGETAKSARLVFNIEHEVEDLAVFNNDLSLATVGGRFTKIWDTRKTDVPLVSLCNNSKTVNKVWVAEKENRLLTSSIDCTLKIYSLEGMSTNSGAEALKLVSQQKYARPITTLALTSDMSHLSVGFSDGHFKLSKNKEKEVRESQPDEMAYLLNLAGGNGNGRTEQGLDYKYFFRGMYKNKSRAQVDETLETKRGIRLAKYDLFLKKFRYTDALIEALNTRNTNVILAVVEELAYRDGLERAVSNLNDKAMLELLGFIYKKIDSPMHSHLIYPLFSLVLSKVNSSCPTSSADDKITRLLRDTADKLEEVENLCKQAIQKASLNDGLSRETKARNHVKEMVMEELA